MARYNPKEKQKIRVELPRINKYDFEGYHNPSEIIQSLQDIIDSVPIEHRDELMINLNSCNDTDYYGSGYAYLEVSACYYREESDLEVQTRLLAVKEAQKEQQKKKDAADLAEYLRLNKKFKRLKKKFGDDVNIDLTTK